MRLSAHYVEVKVGSARYMSRASSTKLWLHMPVMRYLHIPLPGTGANMQQMKPHIKLGRVTRGLLSQLLLWHAAARRLSSGPWEPRGCTCSLRDAATLTRHRFLLQFSIHKQQGTAMAETSSFHMACATSL